MRIKRALLLIFLLVAGGVAGALLASLCADINGLSWLAFSRTIGFNTDAPLVLDLDVFKFTFGFSIQLSVAQVLTVALAILVYNLLTKRGK